MTDTHMDLSVLWFLAQTAAGDMVRLMADPAQVVLVYRCMEAML